MNLFTTASVEPINRDFQVVRPFVPWHCGLVPVQPEDVKQVIVIRRDLNMRRGKEIAQGSHASSAWMADLMTSLITAEPREDARLIYEAIDEAARVWLTSSFRKVTLQVRGEEEITALHEAAVALGLRSHLIRDSGKTEFAGIATVTALAIGPNLAAEIDRVTGHLTIY
jgi:peptidyl-tRNA hydrolase, PTH2 family